MPGAIRVVRREPDHNVDLPAELHPVLRRVYARRGVGRDALDLSLGQLAPYAALKGIDQACHLLDQALRNDWPILIVGDFDADGASATALAVAGLRQLGATAVDYLIPDRFEHGYGLSPSVVELAAEKSPKLLITVDNGISSVAGVALAQARGMRVLVTDHHLPGPQLPQADAIVNPNQPGCGFASRALAGVGVMFYVLMALRAHLREAGWFQTRSEPGLANYLDLVALGTVADVVPLDFNNRILVEHGLRRIRAGRCCPGILALARVAGRRHERLVASDIGFAVAPRLNAAGRLDDMRLGVQCLLSSSHESAWALAAHLDELNTQRRELQARMQEQAEQALRGLERHLNKELPAGLCLYQRDWHEGIVGLVAGRVRERHHRPVIAFAPAGAQTGTLKGSARSVPGVHIRDALAAIATAHPGMIERFGGHAIAAGLSLEAGQLSAFQAAFAELMGRQLSDEQLRGMVETDGELEAREMGIEAAIALRSAGPWGSAFPEPVFDGRFQVISQRVVGERHLKMRVQPVEGGNSLDAIAFNQGEQLDERRPVQLVYRLDCNEYQGIVNAQLIVTHILPT